MNHKEYPASPTEVPPGRFTPCRFIHTPTTVLYKNAGKKLAPKPTKNKMEHQK